MADFAFWAGQFFGLLSLLLCIWAFSCKQDDRLLMLLLSANVAFALQFLCFGSLTAAALSLLVVVRIALARRYPGSKLAMSVVLVASGLAAAFTWQGWGDLPAVVAMVLGTVGMFMLRGIPMRVTLGLAALAWAVSHILAGSIGGTAAEALVFITNAITIYRLYRTQQRYPSVFQE